MPFTTTIDVCFGDCDPAGIAYFPALYHYCHIAFERSWTEILGFGYPQLVNRERIGFPTVHVETTFSSPARYGDTLSFEVAIPRIGASSVVFRFVASIDARAVLTSSHTKVCTDLDRLESRPLPDYIRAGLERLGSGEH